MGEPEKPLHVRVAEALGCKLKQVDVGASPFANVHPFYWACGCPMPEENLFAREHGSDLEGIRRYDTDWSATGPLIEKYGFCVFLNDAGLWESQQPRLAKATRKRCAACGAQEFDNPFANGASPLVAICNLILALHAAGKLDAPAS